MGVSQLDVAVRRILLVAERAAENESDRQLLQRFVARQDQAAFAALVERHGPLVFSVCRSVLHQERDAQDAFQATFLVLARKASSIRKWDGLASWLHGVALRTALKARQAMRKRRHKEQQTTTRTPEHPVAEAALRELQAVLHEEVGRLAEKHRAPFVLCCLEGKSRLEAAQELGWKEGTVSSRIAQARALLETRLARRGIALPAALTALSLAPAASFATGSFTLSAIAFAAGEAAQDGSAAAVTLAEGVLQSMFITKLKTAAGVTIAVALLLGAGVFAYPALHSDPSDAAVAAPTVHAKDKDGDDEPKKVPGSIDAATVAAYAELGASHYGLGAKDFGVFDFTDNLVLHTWAQYRERGQARVPGFDFYSFPEKPLPQVTVSFALDLANSRASDANLKQLAHLKKLRSLCLSTTKVSDAGLQELAALTELTWLDLSDTPVAGPGLKHLAPLKKNLTTLYLDVKQLTDANLRILNDIGLIHAVVHADRRFRSSTHFVDPVDGEAPPPRPKSAAEVWSFDLHGSKVTDLGMKELAGMRKLESLNLSRTSVADAGLKHLRGCTELATLDLSETLVTDEGLKELAGFDKIASLHLAGSKVTDRGLKALAGLKKLATLTLDGNQLTDEGLRILRELRLLHTLSATTSREASKGKPPSAEDIVQFDLSGAKITDTGLKELADLKNLASLTLSGAKITPAGLKELVNFKKLNTLHLDGEQLTDNALRALRELDLLHVLADARPGRFLTPEYDNRPKSANDIQSLDLRSARFTDDGLAELAVLTNLKSLELGRTQFTGRGFGALAGLKDLTYIGLNGSGLNDAGLKEVARIKSLTSLDLMDTKITADGLKELAALKNLERLYLSPGQFTDASLRVLSELGLLHKLSQASGESAFNGEAYGPDLRSFDDIFIFDLSGSHVTDAGLKELAVLKNLSRIELRGSRVTGVGLKDLSGLKHLRQLHLHENVTDAGLKEIAALKNLNLLAVSGKEVTDAGLKHLTALRSLTNLYLGGTQLSAAGLDDLTALGDISFLWLEANNLTDADMKHVARFGKLTILYLYEPQITDAGLMHLAAAKGLERIILSKTQVTSAGIARLREALPKCQID